MNVYIIFESWEDSDAYRHDMIYAVYECPIMAREVLENLKKDNKASVLNYYIREWEVTPRNIESYSI